MTAWSDPAFERVTQLVGARIGANVALSAAADMETRVRRAMARAQVSDIADYVGMLEVESVPLDDLLAEFTVGETYFFREPQRFELIVREIVPDVLRRRGASHHLRIWSAGCASGEEAYSLAIALENAGINGEILATDISLAALRKARDAMYRPWSLRGLDRARIRECFDPVGNRWLLKDRYRRSVTFAFHNLVQGTQSSVSASISDMDLILCRNVLIYLDKESVIRVAQGLSTSLSEGGWLLTGASDPSLYGLGSLATLVTAHGLVYRKTAASSATSKHSEHSPTSLAEPAARHLSLYLRDGTKETIQQPTCERQASAPAPTGMVRATAEHRVTAEQARAAFVIGRYEHVLRLTEVVDDEASAVWRVRAMANARGSAQASAEATRHIERYPFSTELHHLDAVLHLDLQQDEEVLSSLRRVLYLDRSLAVAHFLLGSVLKRLHRVEEAKKAYSKARELARSWPADHCLPLGDGERAGALVGASSAEIARLEGGERRGS